MMPAGRLAERIGAGPNHTAAILLFGTPRSNNLNQASG
jgi:hypothetical protein